MESQPPPKKPLVGLWIGIAAALLISFLLMGIAGVGLFNYFRNRNITREQTNEYSNPPVQEDKVIKYEDTVKDDGTPVFTVVEDMPQFQGGDEGRINFLTDNIRYPQMAKEEGIQGTVYVTFVIDENGKVTHAEILRGIGGGCDEEALRVVRLMPRWKPGKQSGRNVRVQFNMPIKFTLN